MLLHLIRHVFEILVMLFVGVLDLLPFLKLLVLRDLYAYLGWSQADVVHGDWGH